MILMENDSYGESVVAVRKASEHPSSILFGYTFAILWLWLLSGHPLAFLLALLTKESLASLFVSSFSYPLAILLVILFPSFCI